MNNAAALSFVEVEYDPDCTPQQFEEVLSSLDRWSVRTQGHVTYLRKCERHDYRTGIVLAMADPLARGDSPLSKHLFHVKTRNLSQSGLGLVSPPVFVPRFLSDDTPLVRGEVMFHVGNEVNVRLLPKVGQPLLVRAQISRIRPVHLGFLEIGLAFIDREKSPLLDFRT